MRICILGTRGVPNHHGGFEQFAEFFSKFLVDNGHEVYVYCSSLHPYKKAKWNGVHLIHKTDPENLIGSAGQFIYDLNCILDCRSKQYDIILQLGYTSSSVWNWLFPKKSKIVTNMDGLEWKRSKYSKKVQRFLKLAEKLAVIYSDVLVADSIGIQKYLKEEYEVNSTYIAYGVQTEGEYNDKVLDELKLKEGGYDLLIARMEPENNIEVILDGVVLSNSSKKVIVVGKTDNGFGSYLKEKFRSYKHIQFVGAIYNLPKLNSLRKNSDLYFHGHSVGGTNPSLLEAMASETLICAHDNIFNRSILGDFAFYFSNKTDISKLIAERHKVEFEGKVVGSKDLVVREFSWNKINSEYLSLMNNL